MKAKNLFIAVVVAALAGIPTACSNKGKMYGNPFVTGKLFVNAYIRGDLSAMKRLSSPYLYTKINSLKNTAAAPGASSVQLIKSKLISGKLLRTYSYTEPGHPPMFCSVVLQPSDGTPPSRKIRTAKKWFVSDFFTNEDFDRYISNKVTKIEKGEINPLKSASFTDTIGKILPRAGK